MPRAWPWQRVQLIRAPASPGLRLLPEMSGDRRVDAHLEIAQRAGKRAKAGERFTIGAAKEVLKGGLYDGLGARAGVRKALMLRDPPLDQRCVQLLGCRDRRR